MARLFDGIDLGRGLDVDDDLRPGAGRARHVRGGGRGRGRAPRAPARARSRRTSSRSSSPRRSGWCPSGPAMRLVGDLIAFCTDEMPLWHPISVSGYHIREAGATAAQELAFTIADGLAYVEELVAPGRRPRPLPAALLVLLQLPHRLLRGGRQDPRRPAPVGHADARARRRPRPALVAAAHPRPDLRRLAHGPAAAAQRGPHGHRGARRRASRAPSRSTPTPTTRRSRSRPLESATLALRTQQMIADETGAARSADPLGGS